MTNYEKGRRFEYEVKRLFEEAGYDVVRASSSKSPFDLVAVKYTDENKREVQLAVLCQCKIKKR